MRHSEGHQRGEVWARVPQEPEEEASLRAEELTQEEKEQEPHGPAEGQIRGPENQGWQSP